jgi:FkbM family methyltransferase
VRRVALVNRIVSSLGAISRMSRSLGFERAAHAARDAADRPFVRAGRPPLSVEVDGLRLGGFLRHRSFLDEVSRPGSTYRELFVSEVVRATTVVDAGAHVGLYALLAARENANARVLAFEPDPYNRRALVYNAQRLCLRNVTVLGKALTDRVGRTSFHRSLTTIGSSLTRRDASDVEIPVETTTLDAELEGAQLRSLVVRLNIEGAEPLALDGMRETLAAAGHVTLFAEIHPELQPDPAAFVARLRDLGFDVAWIDRERRSVEPLDPAAPLRKGHVLARRGSRAPT